MYRNLVAEMTRNQIKKTDLAKLLNLRYATILDKLNGKSRFFYDEAKTIKNQYFAGLSLEYLFDSGDSVEKSTA